jgi:hypothetical protein
MIARPAGGRWSAPKTEGVQIERLDKRIDHPSRIVRIDKVFQACWQKRCLRPIHAFDEPAHGLTLP